MLSHSCPIDLHTVDEHAARGNALLTLIFLLLGYFTSPLFWVFLAVDFGLRAARQCRYSLLMQLSRLAFNLLHIHPKLIDRAPKLFAARIGFAMSIFLLIFYYLGMPMFYKLVLIFFLLAASLEAFFSYCLGCQLYSLLTNLKPIKK